MIRFMLIWAISSAIAYVFVFMATKQDRATVWRHWRRGLVAAAIGAAVVVPLFLLNNISGV